MQPTVVVLKGITTCCSEPLKCRSVPKKSLKFWSTSSRISGLLKPQLCLQTIKLHIVIYFVFLKSYLSVSKFVFSTLVQAEGFLLPPKVIVILYILPGFRVFFAACGGNLRCRPEASLRSRRFEVMGAGKNGGRARETSEGRGSACPRGPWKSFPAPYSNNLASAAWSVKSFERKRLTSHRQTLLKRCTFRWKNV